MSPANSMDLDHEKLFQNKHAWVIQSLNILFKYLLHNIVTLWNGDNTVTDVQTNVNVGIYCGYLNSFGHIAHRLPVGL